MGDNCMPAFFFCLFSVLCVVFQTEISFAKVILEQGRDIQVGTGKMAVLDEALQAIPLKPLTHLPVCVVGTQPLPTCQVLFWMDINTLRALSLWR